jgi:2'-5' RNA ligase
MRIFTGIKLAEAAREKITRELNPFRKAGTAIRWTDSNNIHLTLKFIGEADEAMADRIAEALANAKMAAGPFVLRVTGFGKFPEGDDLHIFWAGVEENRDLQALFAGIEEALLPLGIARDSRPFHPHLTLGRNRVSYNFKALFALLSEKRELFLAEWPVARFQLFASRLTPAGPIYSVRKEIPLVQS